MNVVKLEIGENVYIKPKYSPLEAVRLLAKYSIIINKENMTNLESIEAQESLFDEALKKVTVNGILLNDVLKINKHFSDFPAELYEVRKWAFEEGLQDFFPSSKNTQN